MSAERGGVLRRSALGSALRAYVPAAILLLIATVQPVLVSSLHLSPWKGGGFGMFSTVDQPRLRFVRVRVTSREGSELLVLTDRSPAPARLRTLADRARALPTDSNLAALARAVAGFRVEGASAGDDRSPVVEVEVYRLRYLRESGVVAAEGINEYRWSPR